MDVIQSASFTASNSILLGDYTLGFLDHLFDNIEIGKSFMDSGCRESDAMSNLLARGPLGHVAEIFLHPVQVTSQLLDGNQSLLCSLVRGLFRIPSQSERLSRT